MMDAEVLEEKKALRDMYQRNLEAMRMEAMGEDSSSFAEVLKKWIARLDYEIEHHILTPVSCY